MNNIRLIALDMDGTLLDHNQEVSAENIRWIHRALDAGVLVCFATGRGIHSVIPYTEQIGLNTPMVLVNGGEVWKHKRELWVRHTLEEKDILKLRGMAQEMDVWYWAYSINGVFNRENWGNAASEDSWIKFGFFTEDLTKLNIIRDQLAAMDQYEITNSDPRNLEVNPMGVNKATGLQEVCRHLGLNMSQVAAVGDSLNDLAMIQESGFGVAMGNAQEEVKQAADWITASNTEDGVARLIEKVLSANS